jgi:hypothetical protein
MREQRELAEQELAVTAKVDEHSSESYPAELPQTKMDESTDEAVQQQSTATSALSPAKSSSQFFTNSSDPPAKKKTRRVKTTKEYTNEKGYLGMN